MSGSEIGEIQMYCCLPFSYAIKYGLIIINTERIEVEISLKSSLSESEKEEIWDDLYNKANISNIHPDYFYIIHCPWCGTHVSTVIDFDKGVHAGQYRQQGKLGEIEIEFNEILNSLGWNAVGGQLMSR